jgi:hypothetical protein
LTTGFENIATDLVSRRPQQLIDGMKLMHKHKHMHQSIRPMVIFLSKPSHVTWSGIEFWKVMDVPQHENVFLVSCSYLTSEVLTEDRASVTGDMLGRLVISGALWSRAKTCFSLRVQPPVPCYSPLIPFLEHRVSHWWIEYPIRINLRFNLVRVSIRNYRESRFKDCWVVSLPDSMIYGNIQMGTQWEDLSGTYWKA